MSEPMRAEKWGHRVTVSTELLAIAGVAFQEGFQGWLDNFPRRAEVL
jgi:hypothetical protein